MDKIYFMKTWCDYCDPKYFVIYGLCTNCKRRCEPPLYDPHGEVSINDWSKMRHSWNQERSDLIIDAIRRDSR